MVGSIALTVMLLAVLAMHLVAPRACARGRVKNGVLVSALSQWLLYAALCVGVPYSTGGELAPTGAALYVVFLALLLALHFPLLRKLRRPDFEPG